MPSNLRALAEVMSELAVYSHRDISGELARFVASPSTVKFDVLYKKLAQYLDNVPLEEFGEWVKSNLLT